MKDVTLHHRYKALLEAMEETIRQQGKWGDQTYDSVIEPPVWYTNYYTLPSEHKAKQMTDLRMQAGTVTWTDIALEEFVEAVAADSDEEREIELIQLIAVCASWIGDIRRKRDQPQPSSDPA